MSLKSEKISNDRFVTLLNCWYIAIAGAFHFEAYFESTKNICLKNTAYVYR